MAAIGHCPKETIQFFIHNLNTKKRMKRIYALLTLLGLFFFAATPAVAQEEVDEVTISVNMAGGDWQKWNGNAGNPWARSWFSSSTPAISVCCKQGSNSTTDIRGNNFAGANNMSVWGSAKSDLMFFTNYGTYEIMVEEGWYIASVEFDFNCANNIDQNDGSLGVTLGENEEVISSAKDDNQHVEWTNEDEEVYSVQFIVSRKEGSYNFARTSNFQVVVKRMGELTQALQALEAAIAKYAPYTQEGSTPFLYDGLPGNYTEETVTNFETAYSTLMDVENWEDEQLTIENIEAVIKDVEDAYNAVLASKVPFVLTDGYYRFRTGMNYNDGNLKYMYTTINGTSFAGRWGTLEDLETNCTALWKVTANTDGSYDIMSAATDARFNDNPSTLSAESENMFVFEPAATINDVTYVDIRYLKKAQGGNSYIHQANHGSGAGTGSNLTTWYPLSSGTTMTASEWIVEAVPAEDAQAIINAYAPTKEKTQLLIDYVSLKTEVKEALVQAKDIQEYKDLISEENAASQFSSPWTETSEGIGKSGNWGELLDGVNTTYWHSVFSGGNVPNHTHYLQVMLNEPVYDLIQMKITRRPVANDHITLWGVWGCNDPNEVVKEAVYWTDQDELPDGVNVGDVKEEPVLGNWEELASLSTPFGTNTETKVSEEFDTKGYKYLRFYIDGTTTGRGYGHVSEFQLVVPVVNPKSQYAYMGEVATNLDALYRELAAIADEDITKTQYESLVAAYDAFKAQFVDPTELRELLAELKGFANGVLVGTDPGYWADAAVGTALKDTYDEAKQYDADGIYVANKSNEYIETLKAQAETAKASAIGIQEGKWYRIHFGSKDTFEANEWDIDNNEAQIVGDDIVINEALWDKYITVAKRATEEAVYYEEVDDGNGGTTPEEKKATKNMVVPYDEYDVISRGAALYFDADGDIEDKDLSIFSFINVGDSAYAIQNKATGLFLRAENTTLDVIPSLFNVSALGYGQNLIAASNIITGASQNYLHFQRTQNRVVTYGENIAGIRSALYIEEVEDVASEYDGTDFFMALKPGSLHAFCFPVDLQPVENEETSHEYVFYDVISVAEGVVKLNTIQEANAGRPFVFIVEGEYDAEAEDDEMLVPFKHGYEFTDKAIGTSLLKGTYSTITELGKGVIAVQPEGFVVNKSNISAMGGLTVSAYSAYVADEEAFPLDVNYTYEISELADGIEATLKTVAKTGAIYTIDGRLVSKSGNLNTLRRLGKGTYILNGTKVVVK